LRLPILAPYLTAAGFVTKPPATAPPGGPAGPALVAAVESGNPLLDDPDFLEFASAFMNGEDAPENLGHLIAIAHKKKAGSP
jgi:hypothetical protein